MTFCLNLALTYNNGNAYDASNQGHTSPRKYTSLITTRRDTVNDTLHGQLILILHPRVRASLNNPCCMQICHEGGRLVDKSQYECKHVRRVKE